MFILDNIDYSSGLVDCLCASALLSSTDLFVKLYVINDLLFNCLSPKLGTEKMKKSLMKTLPELGERAGLFVSQIPSKEEFEILRVKITKVLKSWKEWSVLTENFVNGIEATVFRRRLLEEFPLVKLAYEASRPRDSDIKLTSVQGNCERNGIEFLVTTPEVSAHRYDFIQLYQQLKTEEKVHSMVQKVFLEKPELTPTEINNALQLMNSSTVVLRTVPLDDLAEKLAKVLYLIRSRVESIEEENVDGVEMWEEDYALIGCGRSQLSKELDGILCFQVP